MTNTLVYNTRVYERCFHLIIKPKHYKPYTPNKDCLPFVDSRASVY